MLLLDESRSKQAGRKYGAEWLKTFIPEGPVEYIPVIEPNWNTQHPVSEIESI